MKEKLEKLIEQYINDCFHYGEELHHQQSLVLNELKTNLGLLQEDTKDNCMSMITEFQKKKPEHKELLTDFLRYVKYAK